MNVKLFVLLSCLFIFHFIGNCQDFSDKNIPVTIGENLLPNAFAGGHNVPQFSHADFNEDGMMDLYVFDREGGVSRTYLQVVENGSPVYRFAPEYQETFPELRNFAFLVDYDNDGAADIFSSSGPEGIPGIRVWKGFYDDGKLQFERVEFDNSLGSDILTFPISNGDTNINVTNIDLPAITDVDNDGDIDLLTFDQGGSYLIWFKNTAIENGDPLSELNFVIEDDCWGGFKEAGLSPEITLSNAPGLCAQGMAPEVIVNERHAGSTTLAIDADGDLDKDVYIGDLISLEVIKLTNAGTPQEAFMDQQEIGWPQNGTPVDINFPAGFHVDTNLDGLRDIVFAPNETNNSLSYEVAWEYQNTGTANNPEFTFQQNDFLVNSMIDLGENSYPAFADVTGDGLLDLVVGNVGFFEPATGNQNSFLFLFENTGSVTEPAFTLIDDNWLNFNQYSNLTNAFHPTFGDLDNDGDLDLLVGENGGSLFFAENTGGEGNAMEFPVIIPQFMDINVGQRSAPTIGDLTQDGLPDILVGNRNKFIAFFENVGSAGNPQFVADVDAGNNTNFFGAIETNQPEHPVTGFSSPILVPDGDNYVLFIAIEGGVVWRYNNVVNGFDETLFRVDDKVGNIDEGREASIAMADIDDDGLLEMMVGNRRGGLRLMDTDFIFGEVSTNHIDNKLEVAVAPNPVRDFLNIRIKNANGYSMDYQIINTIGQIVERGKINQMNNQMEVNSLSNGIYFLRMQSEGQERTVRFVKNSFF